MMLEVNAKNVLRFMASNGLVANASKTAVYTVKKQIKQYTATLPI